MYVTKALEKAVDNSSACFLPRGGTVETEQGRKEVAYNVESEQLATIRSRCLVLLYPSLPVIIQFYTVYYTAKTKCRQEMTRWYKRKDFKLTSGLARSGRLHTVQPHYKRQERHILT